MDAAAPPLLPERFSRWFESRGWSPRAHQLELLETARSRRSVLLIAPTGAGKTLAGSCPASSPCPSARAASRGQPGPRQGVHTLYISPLKALAVDIARNLEAPVAGIGLDIRIETRTGDTPAHKRQRQKQVPPDILLTTPEQIALLLSDARGARCSPTSTR